MIESSYAKLFSCILTSTIWQEDDQTLRVWIAMLALKNRHGDVAGSIPGLAHQARVSLQACERAIAKLAAPDPYSRTPDNEGRRIVAVEGGWRVLNHAKYRDAMSEEKRRAYQAEWQREYRQRQKGAVDRSVDKSTSILTHAEADTDTEYQNKNKNRPRKPRSPAQQRQSRKYFAPPIDPHELDRQLPVADAPSISGIRPQALK